MAITIAEMKRINAAHGYHFFDKATMKFFDSHIISSVSDQGLFLTQETDPNGKRLYSVRLFNKHTGNVVTVGDFHWIYWHKDAESIYRLLNRVLKKAQARELEVLKALSNVTQISTLGVYGDIVYTFIALSTDDDTWPTFKVRINIDENIAELC